MIRKWSRRCYRAGVSLDIQNVFLPSLTVRLNLTLTNGFDNWICNMDQTFGGNSKFACTCNFWGTCLKKPSFLFYSGTVTKTGAKSFGWHWKGSRLSPHQSMNLRFPILKVVSSYYMSKNTDNLCQTYTETRCLCWHINTKNCYHRKISPSKPGLKLIWRDIQRPRWVTFVHMRMCLLRDFLVHVNWLPDGID